MKILKLLFLLLCLPIGVYIFSRAFYMPNSEAAGLCIGTGLFIVFFGIGICLCKE